MVVDVQVTSTKKEDVEVISAIHRQYGCSKPSVGECLALCDYHRAGDMKTLLILRHAKSSWEESDLPNHDRPLNARGKRDAPRVGKLLLKERLIPQLIICSIAERVRRTTKMVGEECGYARKIQLIPDFYLVLAGYSSRFLMALRLTILRLWWLDIIPRWKS